jgi:Xaa-Pro aminopeptidase
MFLHHRSDKTKLKKNQIVLLDFGVKYEGYCSDMSRTVFFGKADEKLKRIYQTVKESQKKAFARLSSKSSIVNLKDIDKIARDHIISKGFSSIPHSLGHQIGIDVHEEPRLSPKSKGKLENNMVFSIEPGIYIPSFGGVRIEDLVLYQNGPKLLTSSNRDLIEI